MGQEFSFQPSKLNGMYLAKSPTGWGRAFPFLTFQTSQLGGYAWYKFDSRFGSRLQWSTSLLGSGNERLIESRQMAQCCPSGERPPPGTMQCTCG
jgi:hypothetical protein